MEDFIDQKIYPKSVTISAGTVEVQDMYSEMFKDSKYIVMLAICSEEPNKNYTVDFTAVDFNGNQPDKSITKFYETIDNNPDYEDFMTSLFSIFKPFKRMVLKFDNDSYMSLSTFGKLIMEWSTSEINKIKDKDI